MKIAMIAPHYYPHVGGVEKHVVRVSEELSKNGHEIIIITIKICFPTKKRVPEG